MSEMASASESSEFRAPGAQADDAHLLAPLRLEGTVARPELSPSELPLLEELERHRLAVHPHGGCVHELFTEQVRRTPQAVALVYEQEQLSYQELDERSNQLAHHLRSIGVGPEVIVGLCLERSVEMVVGLLGVLKTGGAYLPLDPEYPAERLAFMIQDAGAPVILTVALLEHRLPVQTQLICLDRDWSRMSSQPVTDPTFQTHPDHLAYIIYTSGSTGRPKGVSVPHRVIVNLLHWHGRTLRKAERTLQYASLSFDASLHELLASWLTGGSAVLISEAARRDPDALVNFLQTQAIGKAIFPVAMLQRVAEKCVESAVRLPGPIDIVSTGEQLQITTAIRQLFAVAPDCLLHNHYGPSETHVVTSYTFESPAQHWPTHAPIGRPIFNNQIYLLDDHLNPVPLGAVGGLYIGGENLARGYFRRPGLTAERFVPNPFGAAGTRLYCTGDLARYSSDGNLMFLGRIDHQVKIRGFRVELAEVEAALLQHPGLREVVILTSQDNHDGHRLCAYCVAREGCAPSVSELRKCLRERLPHYMIPSTFSFLEVLPLTPNRKVDRQALLRLEHARPQVDTSFVAPRTTAETVIARVYAELLELKSVGVHDDFFELGGHSLLATRLVSRVREIFRFELSLRSFFEAPTVAGIVEKLLQHSSSALVEEIAELYVMVSCISEDKVKSLLRGQ